MNKIFSSNVPSNYKILRDIDDNIQTVIFLEKNNNPLSVQGIKINDKLFHLIFFEKSPTNLNYEFEKGVFLKFYFRDRYIIIRIICPKLKMDVSKVWDAQYARNWSSTSWNNVSKELDYINVLSYENSLVK
tara:strand:+ start:188 stop:580 length:393 start_codon:yes stop_codon:yes gene_type:complete